MADDKTIVTKKTAPKPATETRKTSTKKAPVKKVATKTTTVTPAAEPKGTPTSSATAKPSTVKKATPTSKGGAGLAKSAPPTTPTKKPAARPATPTGNAISLRSIANVSDEERYHMIREAAYYRAEKRQFAPGHEIEDWADAEREIDALLASAKRITGR